MDNDVYVIVLTGAGDKFFSAGANIKMLASVDPDLQVLLLPARQRNAAAAGAHAEAGDRGASTVTASAADSRSRWRPTSASRARMPARSDCRK